MTEASILLAHGVGQIYESPIPLYLYLVGAAATVAVSFLLQSLRGPRPREPRDRLIAGPRAARAIRLVLQAAGIVGLTLALVAGVVVRSEGLTLTTLLFWVGLIVGMIVLSALVSGVWEATDPWTTLEDVYRLEDAPVKERRAPWWITPLALYGLFWFELVSDVGFVDFWIIMVLLGYSLAVFSFRGGLGRAWQQRDPLSVLFSFAGRLAPLKLTDGGVFAKSPVADLAAGGAMPPALFASVFVLLSSTTFDNVGETIAWGAFLTSTGLIDVPPIIVNSLALALFSVLFVVPYIASVTVAHRWTATRLTLRDAALAFGWALVPIGIAYVLAHNAGLLFTGVPVLIRSLSDPFGFGWNLLGTAHLFEGYIVSPALVWFVQIALIVGGHILGVLAAHRIAVPLAGTHGDAVRSEYALTALMCVYTISTLWLLAQPLVSS